MTVSEENQPKRISFTSWIVIGILAGGLCGLFFGESTKSIQWVGDAFVGLLQMAVLPFVAVSLVTNVGRLSLVDGVRLMRVSVVMMALLWAIGIVTLIIVSQAFPHWETGSFFSSRFTEEPPAPNWLDLFIPSNPFRSLSDNSIPAVVVFCIGLGIAMMNLPGKEKFLDPLDVLASGLATLNKLVVKLTPIGMFAIVAYTAGTIDLNQFQLIQGYLIAYGFAAIILSFVVLPAVIAAVTPLSFTQVYLASRGPLLAAFVIGNSFVVLPIIIESIDRLQQERRLARKTDNYQADYLVPLAYPFPDIGRIVGLVFIPFAAWFYGNVIDLETYPTLLGVGLLGSFGKPVTTIPLLLDIAELPSDIFNLFLASGVVAARFGDLMKTMHLMAFSILTICCLNGNLRIHVKRLTVGIAGSLLALVLATVLVRAYLNAEFKDHYSKENLITQREMLFPENTSVAELKTIVLSQSSPNPLPIRNGQSRVERIKEYGNIRIGFLAEIMPFSYYRADTDQLIGFDIQMAYYLAADMGVGIEFVPIHVENLQAQLQNDHFDVAMSALEGTIERAALIPSVDSYMEVTLAVVVPDSHKRDFRDMDQVEAIPDLKLAAIKDSYFAERARTVLKDQIEVVELDSPVEYFDGVFQQVHGLVTSAEKGSAWTLRHPEFTVANPLKGRVHIPLYYLTGDDIEFENFLQNWLALKRSTGVYQDLYDYWILGLDKKSRSTRWCILRNVLGWVD